MNGYLLKILKLGQATPGVWRLQIAALGVGAPKSPKLGHVLQWLFGWRPEHPDSYLQSTISVDQEVASAPSLRVPDPMPISPSDTPLLLACSSFGSPPTLLIFSPVLDPPDLSSIGSPTLPLLPSSAPSRPSPSPGCKIRFTIWGLSCYNNRRRLCREEQLAPCAARLPCCLHPCSLVSYPPHRPQPQPGFLAVWCVCINVPRASPPAKVMWDCLFMVARVNMVYELHIVCARTHTLYLLHFPSTVCDWRRATLAEGPLGRVF